MAPPPPLDARDLVGLSDEEVAARLARFGPNELPSRESRGLLAIALEVVREPMFLLLVGAGALYLTMGEVGDAALLLSFVVVVMVITIVQEQRTERALEALRDLASPRALVLRGGVATRIPGREVVPGDLLVLAEGDRVPADAILRRGANLSADESLLTGESAPVQKHPSDTDELGAPGGEEPHGAWAGTLVTSGQGIAEVVRTGSSTELGRIGKALRDIEPEQTPLQKGSEGLVRRLAVVGLGLSVVVVVVYAVVRGGALAAWKQGLLAGIALAMATLPEELPVILTVFLALGARRLSRVGVLARRMPAVEGLGATTVLCVDKTGTLTENRMRVRRLVALGAEEADHELGEGELPEAVHAVLEHAVLASRRDPFDPMERALLDAAARHLEGTEHLHPGFRTAREYPLTPELLAVGYAYEDPAGGALQVASKGAPEAIAAIAGLDDAARGRLLAKADTLAAEGLRVLAVAAGRRADLPASHASLGLSLVGLVGLEDPLRAEVPRAIDECRTAGIRVVMITGDAPATASSIARAAGLEAPERVVTGAELRELSDEALAERLRGTQVFARVVPDQKLRLVRALRAAGEVVAMTGDGVNDAPALRAADIGVAMGARGTDVAREAAALVLQRDDFGSLVAAVRTGRAVWDNVQKAIAFVLAAHVPIAGLSVLPVFFADWPLLLLPAHVVFLELVIDPACSLLFEAEPAEPDLMTRPPRRPGAPLLSARQALLALLQGASALAAAMAVFLLAKGAHGDDAARALSFSTLVVSLLVLILTNRSPRGGFASWVRPNPTLPWLLGGAAVLLAVVLRFGPAQRLFRFAPVHQDDLALALAAGAACLVWIELVKLGARVRPAARR